jgi:two-component system, LytTR family, response regulator LytT
LLKFEQLRQRFAAPKPIIQHALDAVEQSLRPQQQAIIVRHRDKIIPLEKASIALFYTANGINYALTFDQQKFVVNEHLEQLEQAFAPVFFRANRQFLINRKAVKDAAQHYNRKLQINLNIPFEEEILVGKLKISAFMEWLAHGLV